MCDNSNFVNVCNNISIKMSDAKSVFIFFMLTQKCSPEYTIITLLFNDNL